MRPQLTGNMALVTGASQGYAARGRRLDPERLTDTASDVPKIRICQASLCRFDVTKKLVHRCAKIAGVTHHIFRRLENLCRRATRFPNCDRRSLDIARNILGSTDRTLDIS